MFATIKAFAAKFKTAKFPSAEPVLFTTVPDDNNEWETIVIPKKGPNKLFWERLLTAREFLNGESCKKARALRAFRWLFHTDRFHNCDIDLMELSSLVNSLCDDYDGKKISHEDFAHEMYEQLQTLLDLVSDIEMDTPPQHEDPTTNGSFM